MYQPGFCKPNTKFAAPAPPKLTYFKYPFRFPVFQLYLKLFFFFLRHNGPASAAPCQEGHFWKNFWSKNLPQSRKILMRFPIVKTLFDSKKRDSSAGACAEQCVRQGAAACCVCTKFPRAAAAACAPLARTPCTSAFPPLLPRPFPALPSRRSRPVRTLSQLHAAS